MAASPVVPVSSLLQQPGQAGIDDHDKCKQHQTDGEQHLPVQLGRISPVSYTHLDVYKRQCELPHKIPRHIDSAHRRILIARLQRGIKFAVLQQLAKSGQKLIFAFNNLLQLVLGQLRKADGPNFKNRLVDRSSAPICIVLAEGVFSKYRTAEAHNIFKFLLQPGNLDVYKRQLLICR